VSAAVWEDAQGRQVLVVLVLLPDGTCRLLEAQQLSRDTCSSSIAGGQAGRMNDVAVGSGYACISTLMGVVL
jgi:hypothetical protein